MMASSIPHLFRCPISLELFTDPVTLCTGQTYERSSIEKWMAAGNLTCPVTMQKLHDTSVVPNHTLRHLIDQWFQGTGLDEPFLLSLKQNLSSDQATITSKIQALGTIRALLEESPWIHSHINQLGFVPLLIELISGGSVTRPSAEWLRLVEEGLACIVDILALRPSDGSLCKMFQEGFRLASFKILFKQGSDRIMVLMCKVVEMLSISSETKYPCQIMREIVILICHKEEEISRAALRAVHALCCLENNLENLVKAGAVEGVIGFILRVDQNDKVKDLTAAAASTLEKLVGIDEGKEALLNHPYGVVAVVRNVFRVSSDRQSIESALNSLMVMCSGSASSRASHQAIDAGVLSQLLLLLQSHCSSRTKTKARTLLKLLGT
ncbi:hypothetical protein SAY86_010281 [Trapa natans]|uniref:U-box domain-containing protein n=1 Tax=Trapa natans TaxID=22666 RepID=A0AAN7KYB1_TRANT|nr:hypothetical protein SAY86_010281 [Trapa natans]